MKDYYRNEPTQKQNIAMDTIVRYCPELKDERNACDTKKKASKFIETHIVSSYENRATEQGHTNVKDFLKGRGINL